MNSLILLLSTVAVLIVAWISAYPLQILLIALLIYSGWHLFNIAVLYRCLNNPQKSLPGSFGIWADIFRRIKLREEKNASQIAHFGKEVGDLQVIADNFPDATMVVDEEGRLTWFNSAAVDLLGFKNPQDMGRPVSELIHDEEFAEWLGEAENSQSYLEMQLPRKDSGWLEASMVPVRDQVRLLILRDVTEARNEERIRRDFVTNVSHELRTPLTVMLGYLEIFQDRQADDMSDALQRMHAQAVQMQYMLDDFLELSRLQEVQNEAEETEVEIPAMLAQLQQQAEEISRGNHEFEFDIDDGPNLFGLQSDLESAFRNLVINALKYTPENGRISVQWHDTPEGPTLKVSDTGIGIPAREIPRLTERFYRIGSDRGRKTGGTGLGLAIVKHVLNAHQAQLKIESEYGVGSQFSCVFPPERKVA